MLSDAPQGADLQGNLLRNPSQAAWQALADAAKALLAIANAQLGKDVSCLASQPHIYAPNSINLPAQSDFDSVTVLEAVNRLLTAKAGAGRSDLYLAQLRYALSDFAKGRSRKNLCALTSQELDDWVCHGCPSPRTRKNRIVTLRLLFSFGKRRGWITSNPAESLDIPSREIGKIEIHTPSEVDQIMRHAMSQNKGVARALAIRYFAGLRTAETIRLEPENIKLERGFIEVPAIASKTRRRRLVHIQPNLSAWLVATEGEIAGDIYHRVEDVYKAARVRWPKNVTRHSFVSYHLAAFENAAKTALEAGHSESILFAHYRELVTPDDAKAYWAIVP